MSHPLRSLLNVAKMETLSDFPAKLASWNVYEPVIDLITQAASGPDEAEVKLCLFEVMHAKKFRGPATEEIESILSYIPAVARTYAAFRDENSQFQYVARMALAYSIGQHDVPGNHLFDMDTDKRLLDGVRGAILYNCIQDEFINPDYEDLEWLGKNWELLAPFASLLHERKDASREFCSMLLLQQEQGASVVLQHGIL